MRNANRSGGAVAENEPAGIRRFLIWQRHVSGTSGSHSALIIGNQLKISGVTDADHGASAVMTIIAEPYQNRKRVCCFAGKK
jgi:hypothetical protein